jgi:phosphoglycerate kinase
VNKKTIRDVDVSGKTCLVRVDFNVPVDPATGMIADDSRIRAAVPTVHHLQANGARIILCTHNGRPKGKVVEDLRLTAIRQRASDWMNTDIVDAGLPGDGRNPADVISKLAPGGIAMLENLRFHPGEEANDPKFAKALASLADTYVNDAFGAAHRAHASTAGVADYLPAVAGYLMERELRMLTRALESDEKPAVAIIGGAKVSDKIQVLANLSKRVDTVIIGGGMVAAFLKAQGYEPGAAEISDEDVHAAGQLLFSSQAKVITPSDVVVAREFAEDATPYVVEVTDVPSDSLILDIGPATRVAYADEIIEAKRIIWNGPMGVAEWESFAEGTRAVARAVAVAPDAFTLVGGGSTVAVIQKLNLRSEITHVSTGGGASLEFLEGKVLPGIAALDDK